MASEQKNFDELNAATALTLAQLQCQIRSQQETQILTHTQVGSQDTSLREKCPHSEFFWSAFAHIRTECGEIRCISLYSVQMRENKDQKNYKYGHFSPCDHC